MKILAKNKWRGGFLDYHRNPEEYRLKILAIKNLEKIEDAYIVRPKSPRMVWNYLWRFGPRAVWRKIKSRLDEESRNEKFVSIGVGKVIEAPESGNLEIGSRVIFILPLHPAALERAVLPAELLREYSQNAPDVHDTEILHIPLKNDGGDKWWATIAGWSSYSGIKLDEDLCSRIIQRAEEIITNEDWNKARKLPMSNVSTSEVRRTSEVPKLKNERRLRAILFGFGNYAKVQIIPNIKKHIELIGIHEIDPVQIYPPKFFGEKFERVPYTDTAPMPRVNEEYDALFIAGYHHTHTPLAIEALKKNKYAVVEKPIAVDRIQLNNLLETLKQHQGKFLTGFHKRYSPFNSLIFKDLKIKRGKPINYHCIAYEVPYPKYFWYNWPNSKGPITANGCHWIDHFLYLNNWSKPKRLELFLTLDMTTNSSIELENDAIFTMTLTEQGSPYIGVQDYVELRAGDRTAKIIDDSRYIAEGPNGVVRKKTINKMKNYQLMYETVSKKIAEGSAGDPLESVEVSTEAMLNLEEKFQKQLDALKE